MDTVVNCIERDTKGRAQAEKRGSRISTADAAQLQTDTLLVVGGRADLVGVGLVGNVLGNKGLEAGRAHALRPLQRQAKDAVPGQGGKHTEGARDAKEHGVVAGLLQAVVLQQDAAVGVDVGPGVLGLAVLEQHGRDHVVELADQLEHGVIARQLLVLVVIPNLQFELVLLLLQWRPLSLCWLLHQSHSILESIQLLNV